MTDEHTLFTTEAGGHYVYTDHLRLLQQPPPTSPGITVGVRNDCCSPLRASAWAASLRGHPDCVFAEAIVRGLEKGFRIGFDRTSQLVPAERNMPSTTEHDDVVADYIDTELRKKRFLGPYSLDEIGGVQINRIGVIPKGHTPGKWRIITDLSFPIGGSVNDGIDPELCSLSYVSVDEVASIAASLGKGALLAKIDIESAYRLIPVHPDDRSLLGIRWRGKVVVDGMLHLHIHIHIYIYINAMYTYTCTHTINTMYTYHQRTHNINIPP